LQLPKAKLFCEQFNELVDKETLKTLRKELFAYTLIIAEMRAIDDREFEIDLESPRVKNLHVKHYFCLAYFIMLFVQLADEIEARKQKVESQIMLVQEHMSTKMNEHFS
jgi:hypothetical protein